MGGREGSSPVWDGAAASLAAVFRRHEPADGRQRGPHGSDVQGKSILRPELNFTYVTSEE